MDLLDLFYFLLGGLLFWGMRRAPKGEWNSEYTSRDQTGAVRGAAVLFRLLRESVMKLFPYGRDIPCVRDRDEAGGSLTRNGKPAGKNLSFRYVEWDRRAWYNHLCISLC